MYIGLLSFTFDLLTYHMLPDDLLILGRQVHFYFDLTVMFGTLQYFTLILKEMILWTLDTYIYIYIYIKYLTAP